MSNFEIQIQKIQKAEAAGFSKVILFDADYTTIRELRAIYEIEQGFSTPSVFGHVKLEMGHIVKLN